MTAESLPTMLNVLARGRITQREVLAPNQLSHGASSFQPGMQGNEGFLYPIRGNSGERQSSTLCHRDFICTGSCL